MPPQTVKKLLKSIIIKDNYNTIRCKDKMIDMLVRIIYTFHFNHLKEYYILFPTEDKTFEEVYKIYQKVKAFYEKKYNIQFLENHIWETKKEQKYDLQDSIINEKMYIKSTLNLEKSDITMKLHCKDNNIYLVLIDTSKILYE